MNLEAACQNRNMRSTSWERRGTSGWDLRPRRRCHGTGETPVFKCDYIVSLLDNSAHGPWNDKHSTGTAKARQHAGFGFGHV